VRATKVRIEGAKPPVFVLSGSGILAHLVVYDAKAADEEECNRVPIWEIEPVTGYANGRRVEEIGNVQYGRLPEGYRQVCPENGGAPPPLTKGTTYEYWFDTSDAPHARRYFIIRGGRAIEVDS
jgi:hypothetical protein